MDAFNKLLEQQKSLQEQIRAPSASVSKSPSDPVVVQAPVSDPKANTRKISDNQPRPNSLGRPREVIEVEFVGHPMPPNVFLRTRHKSASEVASESESEHQHPRKTDKPKKYLNANTSLTDM